MIMLQLVAYAVYLVAQSPTLGAGITAGLVLIILAPWAKG